MNKHSIRLIPAICLFALFSTTRAEDAAAALNVEFDLLVVQMPDALALPLIPELRDQKRAAAAAERVIKLIAEKQAKLIGWPCLTTVSGQRAVAEQVDELRYPTEYEPPTKTTAETPVPSNPAPAEPAQPDAGSSPKTATTVTVSEGVPTNFETRNMGVMLEVEPMVGADLKTISMELVPQHVRLLGYHKIEIEQSGKKVIVEQPDFHMNKVKTSLNVQSGDHTLVGVFKVDDPPGQTELFILHSEVKRIK
jgi:hypothetical protein